MIEVSGYSDDIVEFSGDVYDEIDSYNEDTLIEFNDGTVLRMSYEGHWAATVEREGSADYSIAKLIQNNDYYSDVFRIETDKIVRIWRENGDGVYVL